RRVPAHRAVPPARHHLEGAVAADDGVLAGGGRERRLAGGHRGGQEGLAVLVGGQLLAGEADDDHLPGGRDGAGGDAALRRRRRRGRRGRGRGSGGGGGHPRLRGARRRGGGGGDPAAGDGQACGQGEEGGEAHGDQRRVDATLAGRSGWTMDRSAQVEALCAWCAFVLQQLGDATLDAHEARHPGGFVPEQTSEQVMAYYRAVQDWVRRGHEAESSPGYRIDVRLPVDVPGPAGAWRERPPAHLEGMRHAGETIGVRAEAAARELLQHTDPAEHPGATETLQALLARARASARCVEETWSAEPPDRLRTDLERELL